VKKRQDWEERIRLLLRLAKEHGIKVNFNKGKWLHDYAGMNSEAAKAFGYPNTVDGEVEIDSTLPLKRQCENLQHELNELGLMEDGWEYWPAHVNSTQEESLGPRSIHWSRKRRGKTQVKYKGKVYRRWRAGFSPLDKKDIKAGVNFKSSEWSCDCGASYSSLHDLGCDMETCPICKGQLLGCGHIELFGGKTAPEPGGTPYSKRAFERRVLRGEGVKDIKNKILGSVWGDDRGLWMGYPRKEG